MSPLQAPVGAVAQEDTSQIVSLEALTIWDYAIAAGIFVGAIALSRIVRFAVVRWVGRDESEGYGARIMGRFASYLVILLGIVYALNTLRVDLAPLLGALGIAGLALAFAFQDILENFIAGIILLIRRPFRPGEQISSNDYEGTVEDVNLRTTVLLSFDGTTVHVPNAMVLKAPLVNYTRRGERRTTLDVGVAYDVDLDRAQHTILEAVRSTPGIQADPEPQAYVHEFGDSSVNFAVRFWHDPTMADLWKVRDAIARALKRQLDEEGIEIPFPQRVVWIAPGSDALPLEEGS